MFARFAPLVLQTMGFDPMNNVRPLLGTTSSFAEAYPNIEELQIKVIHDRFGHYIQEEWYRTETMTRGSMSSHVTCRNPRCRRGGFDVDGLLRGMEICKETEKTISFFCKGDEGSPQGRRQGAPCENFIEVIAKVTYRK